MADAQSSDRLVSWKEIAAYLRCEERTAQRWERDRQLPVHRLPGDKRGVVFAFRRELDAWLSQQAAESQIGSCADRAAAPARKWLAVPNSTTVISVAVLLLISVLGYFVWAKRSTQADVKRPAVAAYSGPFLIVKDRQGNELWRYKFSADLQVQGEELEPSRHIRFVDVDGDGSVETLAAVGFLQHSGRPRNSQTELLCFSSDGNLRWRFAPREEFTFGGKAYSPPYIVSTVFVPQGESEKDIWVAFVHNTWWPTLLVKVDAQGRELARFVNSGYIYALAELKNAAGHFVLAGGVNNEYDSGMLAVLRADNPTGVSPQTPGSPFACQNCPKGESYRYLIFPRSELNRLTPSAYNKVVGIDILQNRTKVMTREVEDPRYGFSEAIFEFSHGFELLLAQPGDSYWNLHRILEQEGRVRHSGRNCPDRDGLPTPREWRQGRWHDMTLVVPSSRYTPGE